MEAQEDAPTLEGGEEGEEKKGETAVVKPPLENTRGKKAVDKKQKAKPRFGKRHQQAEQSDDEPDQRHAQKKKKMKKR